MTISSLFSRSKRPLFYLSFILAMSCAGGDDEGYFMSFFQPETSVKGPGFHDYHFSPSFFYGSGGGYENFYSDSDLYAQDDNLTEWIRYIGGNFSVQEAGQAIYRRNKSTYYSADSKEQISTAFLDAIKTHPAAKKYLDFAWDVEDAQTKAAQWDSEPSGKDSAALTKLLPEALKLARSEKDEFLKERYSFQAIKICGELRKLDEEIKLYTEFFAKLPSHSVMQYWAECRAGGAFLLKQDTAQAIYHFAQVFQNCPSKRYAAYLSLRLNDVKFFPGAIVYCRTGKEKTAVYAICATQPWQESTDILKQMVAADPSDSLLRLVYTRELNKVEYDKYYSEPYYFEPESRDTVRLARQSASNSSAQKLKDFAMATSANDAVSDHAFWFTAAAHASFLADDFSGSDELLAQAEAIGTPDTVLRDQMILQKFLLFSELTKKMTPEKEDELMPMLERFSDKRNMQHSNAFSYAATRIEKLYGSPSVPVIRGGFMGCASSTSNESSAGTQFTEAKGFIFHLLSRAPNDYTGYSYFSSPDRKNDLGLINDLSPSHTVDATIKYFAIANPRDYDKRLQKLSGISPNPLYRLMGTRALAEQKYGEAEEAFSHIDTMLWKSEPYTTYLAANPFWTGTLDSHAAVAADTIRYTPFTYAKKMSDLFKNVQHGGSAEECFELACGSYNLSAWGNSWLMMRDSWSGADELGGYY
ncbi:MAG: hypothetical protein ACHQM6_08595, partial [Candidatus Kapaibacterium sp.]